MNNFQLSDVERKILSILRENSRISYKKISKRTGVSISTVHNVIKRLLDEGVIKRFSIKMDSGKIGFDVTVIIGVSVKQGSLRDVEQQLINHPKVCQSFVVTGEYDLIIIAKFKNTSELNDFIRNFLQEIKGTERTNTNVVLSTLKERLNPTWKY